MQAVKGILLVTVIATLLAIGNYLGIFVGFSKALYATITWWSAIGIIAFVVYIANEDEDHVEALAFAAIPIALGFIIYTIAILAW